MRSYFKSLDYTQVNRAVLLGQCVNQSFYIRVYRNRPCGLESGSCVLTASYMTTYYAFIVPTIASSKDELNY